jgi:hypothetical protein
LLRLLMLYAGCLPGSLGALLFKQCPPEFILDAAEFCRCIGVLRFRPAMISTEHRQLLRPLAGGARSEQSGPESRLRQAMCAKLFVGMMKLTRCCGLCLPCRRRHCLKPSDSFYGGITLRYSAGFYLS